MNPASRRAAAKLIPVCTRCEHYRVTWESAHPHACKAFGFRSAKRPSEAVYESSGSLCRMFRPKRRRTG